MEFDEPSYEDLKEQLAALELVVDQQAAENAEVRALLAARDARVAELEARLADLEERLGRNPRNSSMPPSAEGPSKPPANRQQRRSEARRQGKQPGAEGKHLAQVADPDEVLLHTPPACPDCGAGLEGAEVVGDEVRQVFDLPRMGPHVTEHHLLRLRCRCGCEVKAEAPADATAPACYGYGVRALACYLAVHQHLPYERMSQLFSDVLGIEVSVGALATMVGEAGGMLGGFSETVRDLLRDAPAVNFDETGGRVAGSLHWVHVACSPLYTLIECHKKRGRVAMGEMGVIEKMRGVAVHDGWKPYRSYDVSHQLCNAHHLRELEGVGVVFNQGWAKEMIELLIEAKEVVEAAKAAGRERLEPSALHSIRVRYGMLVAKGWAANPAPATGKRHGVQRKAANLLVRLDGQRDDVLRFATDFRASWDNNQAERDVRMVKLQQKISGSWRTLAGARAYCSIRSYISTMRKHDADVLDGLRRMFEGQAWLPART